SGPSAQVAFPREATPPRCARAGWEATGMRCRPASPLRSMRSGPKPSRPRPVLPPTPRLRPRCAATFPSPPQTGEENFQALKAAPPQPRVAQTHCRSVLAPHDLLRDSRGDASMTTAAQLRHELHDAEMRLLDELRRLRRVGRGVGESPQFRLTP